MIDMSEDDILNMPQDDLVKRIMAMQKWLSLATDFSIDYQGWRIAIFRQEDGKWYANLHGGDEVHGITPGSYTKTPQIGPRYGEQCPFDLPQTAARTARDLIDHFSAQKPEQTTAPPMTFEEVLEYAKSDALATHALHDMFKDVEVDVHGHIIEPKMPDMPAMPKMPKMPKPPKPPLSSYSKWKAKKHYNKPCHHDQDVIVTNHYETYDGYSTYEHTCLQCGKTWKI